MQEVVSPMPRQPDPDAALAPPTAEEQRHLLAFCRRYVRLERTQSRLRAALRIQEQRQHALRQRLLAALLPSPPPAEEAQRCATAAGPSEGASGRPRAPTCWLLPAAAAAAAADVQGPLYVRLLPPAGQRAIDEVLIARAAARLADGSLLAEQREEDPATAAALLGGGLFTAVTAEARRPQPLQVVRHGERGHPRPLPIVPPSAAADAVALFRCQARCCDLRRHKAQADRAKARLTRLEDGDEEEEEEDEDEEDEDEEEALQRNVLARFLQRVSPSRWTVRVRAPMMGADGRRPMTRLLSLQCRRDIPRYCPVDQLRAACHAAAAAAIAHAGWDPEAPYYRHCAAILCDGRLLARVPRLLAREVYRRRWERSTVRTVLSLLPIGPEGLPSAVAPGLASGSDDADEDDHESEEEPADDVSV